MNLIVVLRQLCMIRNSASVINGEILPFRSLIPFFIDEYIFF